MLQAGYVFCHRCGHATQDAYYYNNVMNTWVQLFRNKFTGGFSVESYVPPYMQGEMDINEIGKIKSFRLAPINSKRVQGLQHKIQVECYVDGRMESMEFVRSCPVCVGQRKEWTEVNELLPGLGNLPTFVVAVIGARTVGKSCWIHALSCPENINKVNNCVNTLRDSSGYILSTSKWEKTLNEMIQPNQLKERGKTRMMPIKKKVGGTGTDEVAQVLVMDFAGELFAADKQEEFECGAAHIFRGGEGYSGVDAVVLMTDPLPEQAGYSLAETYERARGEYNILRNKPIAFVMNKADILIENPPKYHINNDENLIAVDVISEYTFSYQGSDMYRKRNILPRVALQTAILQRVNELVKAIAAEERSAGFIIKSTEPSSVINSETGVEEPMLDFRSSMNVMDPFLWILNELDIFPIND